MSDAQKLSAPAFQDEVSGLELGVGGQRAAHGPRGQALAALRGDDDRHARTAASCAASPALGARAVRPLHRKGARSRRSASRRHGSKQMQPFADRVEVARRAVFAVVFTSDNRAAPGDGRTSRAKARHASGCERGQAAIPSCTAQLHVVPATEKRARHERRTTRFCPGRDRGSAIEITRDRIRCAARVPLQLRGRRRVSSMARTSMMARCRRATCSCTAPATSSASTRARSFARSRATGSRTSSRTISPPSSSTTRICRGATRPRAPDAAGARLLPWIMLVVLKEERSSTKAVMPRIGRCRTSR